MLMSRKMILTGLVISFSLFILSACIVDVGSIVGYPTPTPITPSPTPRICPPNTKLLDGNNLKSTPTLFIFIYNQDSTLNGPGLEFKAGENTHDAFGFINQIIPDLLGPGDEYSLFKFGYSGYNVARVGGFQSRIPNSPAVLSTPLPYQTATPYPTIDVANLPALERLQKLNEYNNNIAKQKSEIEQGLFEQNCLENNYNQSINATATLWSATKSAESIEIATKITEDQGKKDNVAVPTTYPDVYRGLTYVSYDFNYLCPKYEKCFLIIISDLSDWRNPSALTRIPKDINVDLKKVNLITIIPNCDTIQDPVCQDMIGRWDDKFKTFGAISTKYFNGIRLEENLVNYVNEIRNNTATSTPTP